MSFVPYYDRIEVKPRRKEQLISSHEESLITEGEVIAVGESVRFVKPGDTLYFDSWGCAKTESADGEAHYVVPERSEVILGKREHGAI